MRRSAATVYWILTFAGGICATLGCGSQGRSEPDFTGRYSYTGTNPDGSTYVGQWIIEIKRTGETYHATWTKEGEEPSQGVGIVDNGKLYIGYDQAPGLPGLIVIEPGDNGTLKDVWTTVGHEKLGTDVLTPIE